MTEEIKPFTTDGCSGGMSWFWRTFLGHPPPWEGDCVEHDKAYWEGGTKEQRRKADLKLCRRVGDKGYPILGWLMFAGVYVGGSPLLPFSWRWGYGYSWYKGYTK